MGTESSIEAERQPPRTICFTASSTAREAISVPERRASTEYRAVCAGHGYWVWVWLGSSPVFWRSCANVDDARECSMRRQCKLQSLHSNIRLETSCVLACVNTTAFVCHRAGTGARRHRQLRTRAYGAFSPPPPALKKAPPRATLQGGGRPCRASTSGRGHGAWRCSAGATPKARA